MDEKREKGRVLCVDWGLKNIGLAVSDPTRTIASPLSVIKHVSRSKDAENIVRKAQDEEAEMIVVGATYLDSGKPTHSGRSALRLLEAIRNISSLPVVAWEEGGSTRRARLVRKQAGASRNNRGGHLDAAAAAHILQDFLDAKENT